MGEDKTISDDRHCFELDSVCGDLVYSLDGGSQVTLHFTSAVKICVVYNTCDKPHYEALAPSLHHDAEFEPGVSSQHDSEDSYQVKTSQSRLGRLRRDSLNNKSDEARSQFEVDEDIDNVVDIDPAIQQPTNSMTTRSRSKRTPKTSPDLLYSMRTRNKSKREKGAFLATPTQNEVETERSQSSSSMSRNDAVVETVTESQTTKIDNEDTNQCDKEGKEVKCKYCCVVFPSQAEYFKHRKNTESTHQCQVCGKKEPFLAHLIVHRQQHTEPTLDGEESQFGDFIRKQSSEGNESHIRKARSDTPNRGEGCKKKEPMRCFICDLVVSSVDSLKIHTMLHTGECPYVCCVCEEKFSSLSSRQHHMGTHLTAQRFRCNPCGQRFMSRADLARHKLSHSIACPLCGSTFPNKTSRTCHYRTAHPAEVLKCSLCSNLFPTQDDLDKHMDYHRKGKKKQCPVCGVVVFKLKDHLQLHGQDSQEKFFVCDQCPVRYSRKSSLERHLLIHTGEKPYACDRCPKKFRTNSMLRKHLLTHTREKPFQCEVCGKRCSLKSNLNMHMRIHDSDKVHSCPVCLRSFNHKNSLLGHMRSKHSHTQTAKSGNLHVQATSHMITSDLVPQPSRPNVSYPVHSMNNLPHPSIVETHGIVEQPESTSSLYLNMNTSYLPSQHSTHPTHSHSTLRLGLPSFHTRPGPSHHLGTGTVEFGNFSAPESSHPLQHITQSQHPSVLSLTGGQRKSSHSPTTVSVGLQLQQQSRSSGTTLISSYSPPSTLGVTLQQSRPTTLSHSPPLTLGVGLQQSRPTTLLSHSHSPPILGVGMQQSRSTTLISSHSPPPPLGVGLQSRATTTSLLSHSPPTIGLQATTLMSQSLIDNPGPDVSSQSPHVGLANALLMEADKFFSGQHSS